MAILYTMAVVLFTAALKLVCKACVKRGGVCVCVCQRKPHVLQVTLATRHTPSLHYFPSSHLGALSHLLTPLHVYVPTLPHSLTPSSPLHLPPVYYCPPFCTYSFLSICTYFFFISFHISVVSPSLLPSTSSQTTYPFTLIIPPHSTLRLHTSFHLSLLHLALTCLPSSTSLTSLPPYSPVVSRPLSTPSLPYSTTGSPIHHSTPQPLPRYIIHLSPHLAGSLSPSSPSPHPSILSQQSVILSSSLHVTSPVIFSSVPSFPSYLPFILSKFPS